MINFYFSISKALYDLKICDFQIKSGVPVVRRGRRTAFGVRDVPAASQSEAAEASVAEKVAEIERTNRRRGRRPAVDSGYW